MKKLLSIIFLLTCSYAIAYAQTDSLNWWNPYQNSFPVLEGAVQNIGAMPYVKLNTNSSTIVVRYTINKNAVTNNKSIYLYGVNHDGKWMELKGQPTFGDTITYSFNNIEVDKAYAGKDAELRLFFPYALSIHWMEIGVPKRNTFEPQALTQEKAIVLFTNTTASNLETKELAQFQIKFDRPLIILDPSRNKEISTTANAKIYLLNQVSFPRTKNVQTLKLDNALKFDEPFESKLRTALQESIGKKSTTIPVIQYRDGWYNWRKRHNEELELIKKDAHQNVIIANSIIHFWGGNPKGPASRGEDSWNKYLEPLNVQNMGFGWDRIENALWRVYHDELDGFDAKHIVLMIGTNNLQFNTNEEIITGLEHLISAIKLRQPKASILLSGIFPRRKMEERIVELNDMIEKLATNVHVHFFNIGKELLMPDGKIDESLFSDGLHPNAIGYQRLAPLLAKHLEE